MIAWADEGHLLAVRVEPLAALAHDLVVVVAPLELRPDVVLAIRPRIELATHRVEAVAKAEHAGVEPLRLAEVGGEPIAVALHRVPVPVR